MDPPQVDDMLEIPAHQHINSGDGRDGDMLGVGPHLASEHPSSNIGLCKFARFSIELKSLAVRPRYCAKMDIGLFYRFRSRSVSATQTPSPQLTSLERNIRGSLQHQVEAALTLS